LISERLPASRLLRGSMSLLIGSLAASVGAYLFNVLAGRALGPALYGSALALVSVLTFLSVAAQTMQTMTARDVAAALVDETRDAGEEARVLLRASFVLAVVVFVAMVGVSGPIAEALHLDALGPLVVVGAAGAVGIVLGTLRGVLQGRGRFALLALTLVGDPTLRMISLVALLAVGFTVGAVPGGFLIATATTAAVTGWFGRDRSRRSERGARAGLQLGRLARSVGPYAVAVTASIALYNVDVLVARATLPERDAGIYGAGSILGRAVYFIGSSAGTALLPLVAGATSVPAKIRYLLEALGFTVVLAGGLVAVYAVAPATVITLTYGRSFEVLAPELWIFGVAMLLYALSHLAMSYLVALGRWRVTVPLVVAAVVQAIALGQLHGSVHEIAVVQAGVMLLANVLLWPFVMRELRGSARGY